MDLTALPADGGASHTPEESYDNLWAQVAGNRLAEVRSGKVAAIPGDQVLAEGRRISNPGK